jgi:hypothetical protein
LPVSKSKVRTACVRMIGNEMKSAYQPGDLLNTLPVKCRHCGSPDIDFVPKPYRLTKDIPKGAGMAPALRGNFLVRERVRRVLELTVPDACTFQRTADARSGEAPPLWLAVPNHTLKALYPAPSGPFCPRCRTSRWGVQLEEVWRKMKTFDSGGIDVFKSAAWQTLLVWGDPAPPNQVRYRRDLYFSVRLEALLHRLGVNQQEVTGRLERARWENFEGRPSGEDETWIEDKLRRLDDQGFSELPGSMRRMITPCVKMDGPYETMDQLRKTPTNPLPAKCRHCGFPDMDSVAKPYLLANSTWMPSEIAAAMRGNFLVRERVRRILELVAPNACTFHPTAEAKSRQPSPWFLAVPNQSLQALYPAASGPFCPKCHAPKHGDLDEARSWEKMRRYDSGGIDVFKTLAWGTWEVWEKGRPARRDCRRDLYFSVRLEQLLKRAGVKARLFGFEDVECRPQDKVWVEEKLKVLAEHGLTSAPTLVASQPAGTARKWFTAFLKRNAMKGLNAVDFAAVEKKQKLTLPHDYKDFVLQVGPKSFKNVNHLEVTETTILLPKEMDFRNYRRGKDPSRVGDDAEVDGVVFASTDFGDCYLFDVSVRGDDYPVYWYKHEENLLEPYAPSFAECIKRFAQRN